ncbi:hypothetical protein Tco_0371821 [Tanacetum coccineum]
MANLEFCDTHNMVAYLHKTKGSEGFHQIVDFLNTSHIKYALTENPTIHVSLIQQFWQTAVANTLDSGEVQITATINGKVKLVFEASIKRHLKLEDSDGITTFPNTEIFEQLTLMGPILQGEGSTVLVKSHHTPSGAPTTSQPPLSSSSRIPTRQETEVPQPSSPTYTNVADEVAFTSVDDIHGGAATTVSSIDAGQGSGNIPKSPTMPHDSPLPGGHTPGSDESSITLHELTVLCTKLSNKVDSLETELKQTKQTYSATLTKLIKKMKKLEQTIKTSQGIFLVTPTKVRSQEDQSEDQIGVLSAAKVPADAAKKNVNTYTRRRRVVSTGSEGVSTASRIFSTAEESVSNVGASMPVSTASRDQQEDQPKDKEQEELLASETTKDEANPLVADIDWDDVQAQIQADEDLAQKLLEEERENLSIEERARLLTELIDKRKKLQAVQRYEAIRNKPQTMSQQRKTMCTYMKNMVGYKMEHFKGKSFYEVKEMFDNVYKQVTSFVPMDSVMEKERTKRAGLNLQEESSKRKKD